MLVVFPLREFIIWNAMPVISLKRVVGLIINGRRARRNNALKRRGNGNGSFVTNFDARDDTAKFEPLLGLLVVENVSRQSLSAKSYENGWLVPEKNPRPLKEFNPVEDLIL